MEQTIVQPERSTTTSLDSNQAPTADLRSSPVQPSRFLVVILVILLVCALGAAAYFYFFPRTAQPLSQVPSPTPTASAIVSVSPDPTAGWQTYTDPKIHITFKFPANYQIISDDDKKAVFGFNVPGRTHPLPYLTLYKGYQLNYYNRSLPNCHVQPYVYPCFDELNNGQEYEFNHINAKQLNVTKGSVDANYRYVQFVDPKLEIEMNISGGGLDGILNQILSTFALTGAQIPDDLSVLIELTKPMRWSDPVDGILYGATDSPAHGILITTPVLDQGMDKLYPLLGTTSILTNQYGWKAEMDGFADGVEESLSVYTVNGKGVIIRTDNKKKLHSVLLTSDLDKLTWKSK